LTQETTIERNKEKKKEKKRKNLIKKNFPYFARAFILISDWKLKKGFLLLG